MTERPNDPYRHVIKSGLKLKGRGTKQNNRKGDAPVEKLVKEVSINSANVASEKVSCSSSTVDDPDAERETGNAQDSLTPAEKAFRLAYTSREKERIAKRLQLTHRQRMEKLNAHLATLSEHFDIPKVGPG